MIFHIKAITLIFFLAIKLYANERNNKVLIRKSIEHLDNKRIHRGYLKFQIKDEEFKSLKEKQRTLFYKSLISPSENIKDLEIGEIKKSKDGMYKVNFSYQSKMPMIVLSKNLYAFDLTYPQINILKYSLQPREKRIKTYFNIDFEKNIYIKESNFSKYALQKCNYKNSFIDISYDISRKKNGVLVTHKYSLNKIDMEVSDEIIKEIENLKSYLNSCSSFYLTYSPGDQTNLENYLFKNDLINDLNLIYLFQNSPQRYRELILKNIDSKYDGSSLLYFKAWNAMIKKDHKSAVSLIDQSVQSKPVYYRAEGYRLICYHELEKDKVHMPQLIDLKSSKNTSQFFKDYYTARYWHRKKDYKKSRKLFNSALKNKDTENRIGNTEFNIIYNSLSYINVIEKKHEENIILNKKSLSSLSSRKANAHAFILNSLIQLKRIDEAIKYMKEKEFPVTNDYLSSKFSEVYQAKAHAELKKENEDDAIKYFNKSLEYYSYSDPYYVLGQIFENRKNYKKAFDSFLEAIKISPNLNGYYRRISTIMLFKLNNDPIYTSLFFSEIRKLNPSHVNNGLVYLCEFFVNNKTDASNKFCKMAANSYPLNPALKDKINKI
tara:strand:+ start:180725 stop:182539 length:1815 start_codon:yes stop_codon:yes gene_type:complete